MIFVIGTVLVIVSAVLAWSVCIAYHLSAPWWRTEAGRHLMTFTAVLAVVLTVWSIGALSPVKGLWWDVLRLATFSAVPAVLGWRLWMVIHIQVWPGLRKRERTR